MSRPRRYFFPKHYADVVQRLRVPLGFALVAAFALLAAPTRVSLMVGLPVAFAGILIRAWAAGHLVKNQQLAMSGPYAFVRNPLYIGTLIAAAGFVIATHEPWLALLFGAAFALIYLPAIELEEQHLRKLFQEYEWYAEQVPMLCPRIPPLKVPGKFQTSIYLRNQEYQAMIGFIAGAAFLWWRTYTGNYGLNL
ncbi:MAG: isoprenylcysteine carboxylmethyltransferase family protein [Bryobacterales bacterium]|nr:isoprenylcysteine carboxylmethyltransferase family protein [Bryobacterales bacterium]